MKNIFNTKQKFFLFSLFIIIILGGFYKMGGATSDPCREGGVFGCYTLGVAVDGQKVSNITGSPAEGQTINTQASCSSPQGDAPICGSGAQLGIGGLTGLNTSYILTVSGSSNPNYVASSVTVKCDGEPTSTFYLSPSGTANLGGMNNGSRNCSVTVNYTKEQLITLEKPPSCPGYTVSACSMGACVERDSSDNCTAVSSCSQAYSCETTIGVSVAPQSVSVAPGETASYDVEISQNFMTSAQIYDLHLFSSMQSAGTSIAWEIPSDQTGNLGFTNTGSSGNNVTVQMKAPKATVRMNVKTDSSVALGSKSFYVTADTGSGPCYGKCTDTKSGLTMVVAPTMTGTLTPRTPGCEIARGASTCDVRFDWRVTNPEVVGGSAVTKNPNFRIATGDNRTNFPIAVKWGGERFFLYNNAKLLDDKTVSGSDVKCVSGTTWNESKQSCETPGPNQCNNGATNYPTCTTCGSGYTITNGTCIPTTPACENGATNYPTCDNNTPPNPTTCSNGATNPPTCTACATGYEMIAGKCTEKNIPVMSGDISAPSECFIGLGEESCEVTLVWDTINPEALSAVTSPYPEAGTVIERANAGRKTLAIKHFASPQNFYLYNNSKLLDQTSVEAECVDGTVWDISLRKCVSDGQNRMTGVLTPESDFCYIPLSGDSCQINFTWMTLNPEAVSSVTSNVTDRGNPSPNNVLATGNNGGPRAFVIPYGSRDFFLYNNGKLLDQTISESIRAICSPETAWDPVRNKCASTTPTPQNPSLPGGPGGGGNPGINIEATPETIFTGDPSTLRWTSIYPSCTGTNFSTGGASSGEVVVKPNTTTTYTITCGGQTKSKTIVVRRKPWYMEN